MLQYNYDKFTFEYIGAVEAGIDELESQSQGKIVYYLPKNSTFLEPLVPKKKYAICFDITRNQWTYAEDHRGETVYKKSDLSPYTVDFIGKIPNQLYFINLPEPQNEFQIWDGENLKFIYPELNILKSTLKTRLDSIYQNKLKTPYKAGEYWVLPEWSSIYTSTIVAIKDDLNEDGILDETYKVLIISNLTPVLTENIIIESLEEFKIYYDVVKTQFKKDTEHYHDIIVEIQNAVTAEEAVNILLNY